MMRTRVMTKTKSFAARIWNVIDKILIGFSTTIMALMSILVVLTVILRYVFNIAYAWSEELIVLLFIATTYFGSILCVRDKEHIDIPFLREMMPDTLGFIMDIFVSLVNIAVQVSLMIISFEWIRKTGSSMTPGLHIQYYYVYAIFPISLGSMAIYTIRRIVNLIAERVKGKDGGEN